MLLFRRNHERHQPIIAALGCALGHGDGPDARRTRQVTLDITGLDAEAAHLELRIKAAKMLEVAVRQPAAEIAGTIHPFARVPGIGQEALGGEIGLPTVAECNAVAGDEDLAFDAKRYEPEPVIEHVQARVANRCADDNGLRISRHLGEARPYGGLGRAVDVPQALAARFERFGQRQRQRFAATQDVQAGRTRPVGIDQHLPGCRRSLHPRRAAKPDLGCQSPTVRRSLLVDDMQLRADADWQQQFEHRDIEGDRRYGRKHVV